MQGETSNSPEFENLRKELSALSERLTNIERSLEKAGVREFISKKKEHLPQDDGIDIKLPFDTKGSIEFRVGEYGMAWLGNIVLFLGLIFLVNYLQNSGNRVISMLVGFAAVASIYVCAHYIRQSLSVISKLLVYNGHFLLYFFTLRLHFFQENPLVESKIPVFILLILVSAVFFYIAFRKKSPGTAGLSLIMLMGAAVVFDSSAVIAIMAAVVAILTLELYRRFAWLKLALFFIFLVYVLHLAWMLSNPFMGNNPEFVASVSGLYVFPILTGIVFSVIAIIPRKETISSELVIVTIIWNGLGFTVILATILLTFFENNYVPISAVVTVLCILYAALLRVKSDIRLIASIYVLYGFLTLSVVIFGVFGLPDSYGLFALQSLLVVSFALWFRSRFMIVMNTILFVVFLAFAVQSHQNNHLTNFSFMLVAFISARIINWQKERLNIKTELVRNLYLLLGFGMTLVAFYHVSPPSYITATWIFAGLLFFLVSYLLKNIKYRWLAISAVVVSAVRLIFVDMSSVNIGYRILAFLGLAIISITVSIWYTKYQVRKKE
ncbi:DUF2339 domain-containing protein [Maribellus sp. YY47]|uniref:DUF2339 domain-containing protein n=1 Tax=Maribellus sp. YY47 TaxID=2929486 RepID=UPI002001B1FC|nr:DUF2339 domain-containing protein [Maribellus sp. YY47]MCK3683589.1 DUF2339 domain-containing protein [Maribellus sp. YY47]